MEILKFNPCVIDYVWLGERLYSVEPPIITDRRELDVRLGDDATYHPEAKTLALREGNGGRTAQKHATHVLGLLDVPAVLIEIA